MNDVLKEKIPAVSISMVVVDQTNKTEKSKVRFSKDIKDKSPTKKKPPGKSIMQDKDLSKSTKIQEKQNDIVSKNQVKDKQMQSENHCESTSAANKKIKINKSGNENKIKQSHTRKPEDLTNKKITKDVSKETNGDNIGRKELE